MTVELLSQGLGVVEQAIALAAGPSDPEAQRILAAARSRRSDARLGLREQRVLGDLARRYRMALAHARRASMPAERDRKAGVAVGALAGLHRLAEGAAPSLEVLDALAARVRAEVGA